MNIPTPLQTLHRLMPGSVNMPIHSHLQTRRFGQSGFSRALLLLSLLALAALAMPVRAATSLITNGSFETSTVGNATLPPGSTAPAGWTILAKVYITAPGTTYWPNNSSRWIDLTDLQGNGFIEQSFATTSGAIYQASIRTFNGGGPTSVGSSIEPVFDAQSRHGREVGNVAREQGRFVGEADAGDFQILGADFLAQEFQPIEAICGVVIPREHQPRGKDLHPRDEW
jgi:hypothetical protein